MSQIVIAKRYAKALFNLAKKERNLETLQEDLSELASAFKTSLDLQKILADTKVPSKVKKDVIDQILDKYQLHPLVCTFAKYLLSKNRIIILPDVETVFANLVRESLGYLEAEITVAVDLPSSLKDKLIAQLSKQSGKKVNVTVKVDPSIIGGVVTRIGSVVIDGSIRNQLTRVHQSIARG